MAFDVNALPVADPARAAAIKKAAMDLAAAAPVAALVTAPGVERWPVKTGTDDDVNQIDQEIVPATVEELVQMPRPADMLSVTSDFQAYQDKRESPVEDTIWKVEGYITTIKLEADGDYHLVLQGASGATMIAEIPTPDQQFVGDSEFLNNIKTARAAADQRLIGNVSPAGFVPMGGVLVPPESFISPPTAPPVPATLLPPKDPNVGGPPAFRTRIDPVKAVITGVGFFDKVHGQSGVSSSNGIELHPVLKLEFP